MENRLNIQTEKPVAFLKIKTTGLDPIKDRIVEISIIRIEKDGSQKSGTRLVNPEMPISADATRVNGITDEMVEKQPTFKEVGEKIFKFIDGCDFVGFNVNFDIKFLIEESNRCGFDFNMIGKKVIDLLEMYHIMEPRDFKAALSFYCDINIDKKTILSSEQTNEQAVKLFNNMVGKYNGVNFENKEGNSVVIDNNIDTLNSLFNKNKDALDSAGFIILNESGRPVFARGKHPGSLVSEILLADKSYYDFLTIKSDLPADTKNIIRKIYDKAKASEKSTAQKA